MRQKRLNRKVLARKTVDHGRILFIEDKLWCIIVFNISSTNVGDQNVILCIFFLHEIFTFCGNCRNKTPTSLSRILDLAEENALPNRNENDQFSVTVLSPTNVAGYITDEDSGHEDGAGTINNLPGSMLLAPPLIDDSSCNNVEDIEEPEGPPNKRKKQTDKPKRDRVKTDLKSELPEWTSDDKKIEELQNKNLTPKDILIYFLMMKL